GELERGSFGWCSKPGALPSTGCCARARTPREMEPREEQSHSRYKLAMGKRRRRPWRPWKARATGKNQAKGLRGALTRGCAQCYRGQAATPGGHPWGPPWESRELPPPGRGARGPPS
ncbi:unnamed protein product, partial [Bubo scandiacus]